MKHLFTNKYFYLLRRNSLGLGVLLLLLLLDWGQAVARTTAAITYTWTANGTSASWSDAASWTPTRTTPDASDVLQFTNNGAAATVLIDFPASSQTISSLFISGASFTFSSDGTDGSGGSTGRTLAIANGSAGADLTLDSDATLLVYTSSTFPGNTGLTLALASGATATISGHLVFDARTTSTATSSQMLQASSPNAVEFRTGSIFTAGANFKGYAFGSALASANSIVFRNGARYEHLAGSAPFGATSTFTITNFEPASAYYYAPAASVGAALSGRTYGNLEYNLPTRIATSSGGGQLTIAGDLILTAGTANINVTGGTILKGNVLMNGGALNFAPASAATVQFAGTTAQRIGGTAAGSSPSFGSTVTVQVNNAAGLTLGQPVSVAGTLQLTSGLLTTSASNTLTLAQSATVSGGSNTSFVNGPMRRPIGDITSATSFVFPVGKGAVYRPLTLNVNSQTGLINYRAEQFEGNADRSLAAYDASNPTRTDLQRVSTLRYFTLTPYNSESVPVVTQPSNFAGTVTLSFGPDDQVADPSLSSLVVAKRSGTTQPWYDFGRSANTTTGTAAVGNSTFASGTLTSGTITSFSDFALASTDPNKASNPLPVQLSSFAAQRTADGPVALAWATASELNSARFEVERSSDGLAFEPVAKVVAQGSSAQAHSYAARDAAAPAARLYYRLKLVDADGSYAYSAVATVSSLLTELALSPNPAREQVSFYTEQTRPYLVRSVLGQVVRQGSTQAEGFTRLDLQGLASGVYFLELPATDANRLVRRFVKE